jgi:putative salt-induced outer membrane protein YdiY
MEWNNDWNEFFDDNVVNREMNQVREQYRIDDEIQRDFFNRGYVRTEITCGTTDTQTDRYNGYKDFDEMENE